MVTCISLSRFSLLSRCNHEEEEKLIEEIHAMSPILVRVTDTVINKNSQKLIGKRFILLTYFHIIVPHLKSGQNSKRAGTWSHELMQSLWKSVAS